MPAAKLVIVEIAAQPGREAAEDDLRHRRHADGMRADNPGHPDLGRRFGGRAGEPHIDPGGQPATPSRSAAPRSAARMAES